MNNYSNIILFCMAVTLSYLIVENACGAGTPDSSFEVIGGAGGSDHNSSIGSISFPADSDESFYMPPVAPIINVGAGVAGNVSAPASSRSRRSDAPLSTIRPAPSNAGTSFFFNFPFEDSIVEAVVEKVPPQIMPRSEVVAVVNSAAQGRSLPPIQECIYIDECDICDDVDCTSESCSDKDTKKQEIKEKKALINSTKESLYVEIAKAVETKKESLIAEVVSYELPASSKALSSNISHVNFDLETRLDSLNNSLTGIASGDGLINHGIWWQISKSSARQKETTQVDGFKSKGNRVIVGYDILTEADNSYGFAYSLISNNITFDVGGSSEHIRHHNYSLYSNQTLTEKLYTPLSISFGHASIKTKRDMLWKHELVHGNTKAKTYNAKVGLAYNIDVPKRSIRLTPQAYLAYESIRVNGFVENGTRISKVKSNVLSSILGLSIAKEIDIQHSKLIPELQYSYKRKLKGKVQDIKLTSTANDELIAVNNQKLNKASHALTSNISISRNKIYSYSLGHQYTKSQDKYTSHTGYVKIRINL